MLDLKIDLVYLWVDDKDSDWKLKKQTWFNFLKIPDLVSNDCCRFCNNEELKYSLRSVEMYAPWINKIYIVTDGQKPKWLDYNNDKIIIIDHKDILPEVCLPTFNSEAIEVCLDKIPNLSECFLYANDDMFFTAPVKPSDFFDKNGKPYVDLRIRNWINPSNLHQQNILYSTNLFSNKYNLSNVELFEPTHCIEAYTKNAITRCKKVFKDEFDKVANYRFRHKDSIQRIIFSLYSLHNGLGILRKHPSTEEQDYQKKVFSLHLNLMSIDIMRQKILGLSPKLLCINDCENTSDEQRLNLKYLLSELFNKPFRYEKQNIEFNISPFYKEKNIVPIVFSFNEKYLKYFAVTLQSIIKNSSKEYQYDIIAFSSNIKQNYHRLLTKMLPKNFNLRFFDILEYVQTNFPDIKLKTTEKWSIDMYYRIFIPLLMSEYEKVLYLDSDIIVECNIQEIFDLPLEGNQILAVRDTASQIFSLTQDKERLEQFEKCLKIKSEYDYFNSGVILFNNKIIKKDFQNYISRIKEAFNMEIIYCPDQDILNLIFDGVTKLVSAKWNFCIGTEIHWKENFMDMITGNYKKDYIESRNNPKIIHYTSGAKPWNHKLELYYENFWKYARMTDFYEEIIFDMNKEIAFKSSIENIKFQRLHLQMEQGERIVLWGASLFLEEFVTKYEIITENIVGIIDKNPQKRGLYVKNMKIYSPEDLSLLNPTDIIITIKNRTLERTREVQQYLKDNNFKNIKIRTI